MQEIASGKPIKVLFPYTGDRFGGSNMSSLVMACGLQDRGHEMVIATHGPGRAFDEAAQRGLTTVELRALSQHPGYSRPDRFRLDHLRALPGCVSFLRREKFDLVHTNDLSMLRTWALPALLTGTPLIAHWRAALPTGKSVQAAMLPARRVISVSTYSKDILPPWVQHKCIVEFNALEQFYDDAMRTEARAAIRARLGCPENTALVGVFGNLTQRKRAHVIADIVQALGEEVSGRPVYGLVCGAPAEPRDTEIDGKIAMLGLVDRIFMPGFVRPVLDWMAACDVILAPAIKEPLARNVLEAMAVGVPTLVSSDGGLREFIADGHDGYVLDPYDLDSWIARCKTLLEDQALAVAVGARAQAKASELSIARHAERIEDIYRAVL